MADEYFYGVTLGAAGESHTWDPNSKEEYPCNYKLIIKQILLGREAKDSEYNVVQVETMSDREPIKIPIAVLKVGEARCVRTDLEFPDAPVTFKLIEGSGPVHIHGQHVPGTLVEEYEDMEDYAEEEILDEEEGEDDGENDGHPKKKRKLSQNAKGGKPAVVAKNNKKK